MKALLQRVSSASVSIDGEIVGQIGRGFCILLGITHSDTEAEAEWLANKIAGIRLFEDEAGKLNLGLKEAEGELLVISQFTLYGDARKGRRPSFINASKPDHSEPLYTLFCAKMRALGFTVATGRFGAEMLVNINNDGPVTLMLERENES